MCFALVDSISLQNFGETDLVEILTRHPSQSRDVWSVSNDEGDGPSDSIDSTSDERGVTTFARVSIEVSTRSTLSPTGIG